MSKKIIFAVPSYASFLKPITQALKALDFQVRHFDFQTPNITTRIISSVSNVCKLNNRSIIQQSVNNHLIRLVCKYKPDYLLVIKGETLMAETINNINQLGVITINWFPDNIGLWKILIKTASEYKYYFSVCTVLTEKLNQIGRKTYYLPVAGCADKKLHNYPKKYDLVFAGHKTRKRLKYLDTIKDLGFTLFGYPHWRQTNLSYLYKGYLKNQQMLNVFRRSKIIVNVSTGEDGTPINIANLKNFEATGVGAFVLSEYNPATADLFKENKEMVFFRNISQLRKYAKYYLIHKLEREKIARHGWLRTALDHRYSDRLINMFNIINTSPE